MAMDDASLRLDGNAFAGMLADVFMPDATAARSACAGCGAVAPIGAQPLYDYPAGPGAVLRCRACQAMLMVIVDAGTRYRVGVAGLTWLEFDRPQT
jgi:Family of unknown function (DUF6510)